MSLAAVAGGWMQQLTFDACTSCVHGEIRRRPYHRNCSCALHGRPRCSGEGGGSCAGKVSYPLRRRFRGASLVATAA